MGQIRERRTSAYGERAGKRLATRDGFDLEVI